MDDLQNKVWVFQLILVVWEHVCISLEDSVLILHLHIHGNSGERRRAERRFTCTQAFDHWRLLLALNLLSYVANTSIRVVASVE